MTTRHTVLLGRVLVGVSLLVGIFWWVIVWRAGALARLSDSGGGAWLLAFGAAQVLGLSLAGVALFRHMGEGPRMMRAAIVLAGLCTLIASLATLISPVLGSPLFLLASVVSVVVLNRGRAAIVT